ncbi:MAG: thiopurine S-methyltransferase, partial [Methylovulum sp.]|nr:thiopurine S-methyltransferase [Methylovulum sp.]
MKTAFWIEKWEKNEIGFHQQDINSHLQTYWQHLGLKPENEILVPLCGKSRDMLWLCAQGHAVLGVEISPIAGRDFFNENNLAPHVTQQGAFQRWEAEGLVILQGDFFKLDAPDVQKVGGVFDRASLVALPPELRQRYSQHLQQILPINAGMLLVAFEYDQNAMAGPPFSVTEDELRMLYQQGYEITPLFEFDILDDYPQIPQRGVNGLL